MKLNQGVGVILFLAMTWAGYAEEAPVANQVVTETVTEVRTEKIAAVEKMTELPGFLSRDGKLIDSIGVETLGGIVTPIIRAGSSAPVTASLKLGVIKSCDCAKLRLYRIPADANQKPMELSYDAIRGFSADNKTVDVVLEVMTDSKLKLKVLTPAKLEPGRFLEWMPASEIKASEKNPEELATVQTWKIASHLTDCQAMALQKCLLIQKLDQKEPAAFYGPIGGFDYEQGFDYVIRVKEIPVKNPSADASSFRYELVELVSKTPAVMREEIDLQDIWVLQHANTETLNAENLKGKLTLELQVKQAVFMGKAPCNSYSGQLQVAPAGHELRFRSPMVTRMACADLAAESDYFRLLESVDTYRREDLELVLLVGDSEVLRFKKWISVLEQRDSKNQ